MHIIVIGLGEVGRHLLQVLEREGHDVVAIDSSAAAIQYAEEHFDVMTLHGFGGTRESLARAGAATADPPSPASQRGPPLTDRNASTGGPGPALSPSPAPDQDAGAQRTDAGC